MLLGCGIPLERPALGVNRLCGSGFQAIVNGAQDILLGAAKISLTGGVDHMSQAPFVARNIRFGTALGTNYALEDSLWVSFIHLQHAKVCKIMILFPLVWYVDWQLGLTDSYCKLPMALTAENLGAEYNVTRARVDEFSLRSQQLWQKGQNEGAFKAEIAAIPLKVKGKVVDFAVDEHPRPQTTIENLNKLKSLFKQDGLVTAGSASVS